MLKKNVLMIAVTFCLIQMWSSLTFKADCAPSPAKPVTIRAVTFQPSTMASMYPFKMFVDKVNERGKGELNINWIGGPEVIAVPDQFEAVRTGAIDMVNVSPDYPAVIPVIPSINLSEYSIAEERESKSGFYDWMVELHKQKMNSFFLGRTETNVQFVIWVKRKVEKPADLAGLKGAGAPWMFLWYKALGISSVMIPTAERYTALQQGIIDVALVPLDTGVSGKFHEVAPYVIDHGVWPAGFLVTLVNMEKWNSLSKKLQDIMISVQKELEPEYGKWRGGEQAKVRQTLKGKVTFIKFSPADAKDYVNLAYSSRWDDAKAKLTPEDYARLRKVLVKSQ